MRSESRGKTSLVLYLNPKLFICVVFVIPSSQMFYALSVVVHTIFFVNKLGNVFYGVVMRECVTYIADVHIILAPN